MTHVDFGAFCAAYISMVFFVSQSFVPVMRESAEQTDSCCGMIQGSAVKFNVMLLILFLMEGRSSSGVII